MSPLLRQRAAVGLELTGALLFYAVAAAALTWPIAAHLGEIVVGGGELGGWLWRYWWHFLEAEALGELDAPWATRLEALVSLGRHPETGNILDVLFISWPLSKLVGFPEHYNLKVLLILTLDGLCGYALARRFAKGRLTALAAGLVAVINPLNIQDINGSGLRQCILWWMLLYPIFLDRAARRQRFRDMAAAGVCLGMGAAWYWFYGLFMGLYTLIFIGWLLLTRQSGLRTLFRWSIPVAVVGMGLALPFVEPYLAADQEGNASLPEMSFFLPFPRYETIAEAPMRPETYAENVLASLNRTIRSAWAADYILLPTSERTMPFVVLLVGLIPALLRRRNLFWLFVFFFFYLSSLGPFLKLSTLRDASEVWIVGGEWVVRLPYAWLFRWVPGMSRMFAPYRLASMVVVASVVLVALGLAAIPLRTRRWRRFQRLACLAVIASTTLQMLYRFEVQEVPEGSYQPSRWRAPTKVSRIHVPAFYYDLDQGHMEGIIELPLGREQDLLYYYQVVHRQKVYRSWATSGALPPVLAESGGGEVGKRMRFLVRQLPLDFPGSDLLERISTHPEELPVESMDVDALALLAHAGKFRKLVVHERGYYLIHPYHGPVLYRDAVQRLAAALGTEPVEIVEHQWMDYPGNQYTVPDGPVYVPWSAEEIALPDQEMPRRLYMSIFDLTPLWERAEALSAEDLSRAGKGPGEGTPPDGSGAGIPETTPPPPDPKTPEVPPVSEE